MVLSRTGVEGIVDRLKGQLDVKSPRLTRVLGSFP